MGAVENYRATTGTEQVKPAPVKKAKPQSTKAAVADNATTTKEALTQVNNQLYERLAIVNAKTSTDSIRENSEKGNTESERSKAGDPAKYDGYTEEQKKYVEDITAWDKKDHGGYFRLGKTPKVLTAIGISEGNIYFDHSKAASALDVHKEITIETLKEIPMVLNAPIVVAESYDNTALLFGELYDESGHPIVVALRVKSTARGSSIELVNKIRSVGTRTHNLNKLLSESNIAYLGEDKKRTDKWFQALGRSTPFGGAKYGSIRMLSFAEQNVNAENVNNENDGDNLTEGKTSPAKTPEIVETTERLEDFGEKIGGARKDAWSSRGLLASDLTDMNEREREANVKKDKVWKRPDYKKLAAGGRNRGVLYAINEIRKSINPNIAYSRSATPESKLKKQEQYISTVREIQKLAEGIETADDVLAIAKWLEDNEYIQIYNGSLRYTEKYRSDPALSGSNLSYQLAYLRSNWIRLDKMADKANFLVDAKSEVPKGYEIYQANGDSHNGEWFITKGHFIVGNYFPTYEDALSALREANNKKKQKTRFVPPQLLEVHRKGPNYRASADVDGDAYIDTFGFKGGEFGNWMSAKDRKVSMNYGFDALKDLAAALGMTDRRPPKIMCKSE